MGRDDADDDAWDGLGAVFVDQHHGSPRGRVRSHVVDGHLRHRLAPPPGRIVDVGAGAGTQSIPLARAGCDVMVVDPSPAMLERPARARAAEGAATAARVHLVEASGEDAPAALDGVRGHSVLMDLDGAARSPGDWGPWPPSAPTARSTGWASRPAATRSTRGRGTASGSSPTAGARAGAGRPRGRRAGRRAGDRAARPVPAAEPAVPLVGQRC